MDEQVELVRPAVFTNTCNVELAALSEILEPGDFETAYQSGCTLSLAEAITVVQDITI